MNFAQITEALKKGKTVRRTTWEKNTYVTMQISQCIGKEIVPRMTSLPDSAKELVAKSGIGSGEILYHDQVLLISFLDYNHPASATYYIPTWADIFATDWEFYKE